MRTRLFSQGDMDAVLGLAEKQVAETLPYLDFRRDLAEQELSRALAEAHPTVFVVETEARVVGFLACTLNQYAFASGVFVRQEVIYVEPGYRGTRAAARLIEEFLDWGETVGAVECIFGSILDGDQPDRTARLFEHFGARRSGTYLRKLL